MAGGAAQIFSINAYYGNTIVRFQGRTVDRGHQAVRVHIRYLLFRAGIILGLGARRHCDASLHTIAFAHWCRAGGACLQ